MIRAVSPQIAYCTSYSMPNKTIDIFLYNWKTGDIIRNPLTIKWTEMNLRVIDLEPGINNSLERRFIITKMISDRGIFEMPIKISWAEDYKDITVTPLRYLIPDGNMMHDFFLSADGQWATCFIGGFKGLGGERLCKRVFFHFDRRYPNGISMPVYVKGYETYQYDWAAFVEHPDHGLCHASEFHQREDDKDQLYLRLYQMSGVLAEINRQLLEKAKGAIQ